MTIYEQRMADALEHIAINYITQMGWIWADRMAIELKHAPDCPTCIANRIITAKRAE